MTICSSKSYFDHLSVAKLLFDMFITEFKSLYGAEYLTSNIHNLNHVIDNVERFGELSSVLAYPFENYLGENYLGIIKRIINAGKNPVVQVSRRLTERLFIDDYNYKSDMQTKSTITIPDNKK